MNLTVTRRQQRDSRFDTLYGCFRMGHNELDDPKITLPHSYTIIEQHLPVLELYAARLEAERIVSATELSGWKVKRSS